MVRFWSLLQPRCFKSCGLNAALDPKNVIRECRDSDEHPNTIPVILALDVTGSMGDAAVAVAKKLNVIMTRLFENIKDVEFMIMGIGDLAYDSTPIQASQFESDIRIAEQLDKLYFEYGGGGIHLNLIVLRGISGYITRILIVGSEERRESSLQWVTKC